MLKQQSAIAKGKIAVTQERNRKDSLLKIPQFLLQCPEMTLWSFLLSRSKIAHIVHSFMGWLDGYFGLISVEHLAGTSEPIRMWSNDIMSGMHSVCLSSKMSFLT